MTPPGLWESSVLQITDQLANQEEDAEMTSQSSANFGGTKAYLPAEPAIPPQQSNETSNLRRYNSNNKTMNSSISETQSQQSPQNVKPLAKRVSSLERPPSFTRDSNLYGYGFVIQEEPEQLSPGFANRSKKDFS